MKFIHTRLRNLVLLTAISVVGACGSAKAESIESTLSTSERSLLIKVGSTLDFEQKHKIDVIFCRYRDNEKAIHELHQKLGSLGEAVERQSIASRKRETPEIHQLRMLEQKCAVDRTAIGILVGPVGLQQIDKALGVPSQFPQVIGM